MQQFDQTGKLYMYTECRYSIHALLVLVATPPPHFYGHFET